MRLNLATHDCTTASNMSWLSVERCGRRGITRESGDLTGVAEVHAE